MFSKDLVCFLIVIIFSFKSESARILAVFPVPMQSHQKVFRVLIEELLKRGHEVTYITTFPIYTQGQASINYKEIDVHQVTEEIKKKLLSEEIDLSEDIEVQFSRTFKMSVSLFDEILGLKQIRNLLQYKSTYFDLILLEDCLKSTLIFSHFFKAPAIQISSFGGTFETFETVGASIHPFLYPLAVRKRHRNLTVWEKISELFVQYRLQKAFHQEEIGNIEVFKKHFGSDMPTLNELKNNVHMLFLNIHPIWDSNRPVPTNVIYLGGLHRRSDEELPMDLISSLESSVNGVVYVSFGTNIDPKLLSSTKLQIFIKVFSKLPYDVYWKWNDENMSGLTKNIKVLKWFPQAELLRHPKVKAFITQGGLQSTDEAIAAGIPLIGIPMMWDQWFNVNKYVELKIGVQLDLNSITETKLRDAIETVIQDKRYKENIVKLHSVMLDQLQSPLERAIWWMEYVIRHKSAIHLRAPSANMNWMEYYEVNLIIFVMLCLMFTLCLLLIILRLLRVFVRKIKMD